jgi:putative glycosyltransferase (TIGR04348 family)
MFRRLGHTVSVETTLGSRQPEVLVALHARRSHDSLRRFKEQWPDRLAILALTGTDLYRDIRTDESARRSLTLADRTIVLQERGPAELPPELRARCHVVVQSVCPPAKVPPPVMDCFEVCVLGHLRDVKDPFRAAAASRLLPADSTIRIVHIGGALQPEMADIARAEEARNPRYSWLGELPRGRAIRRLARSRVMVLSSTMEGGAHAICEAIACGVPIIASRISGNLGLLGEDHPAWFDVGDTARLAELLLQAERDPRWLNALRDRSISRRPLVAPETERRALSRVLEAGTR